jgi:dihydrofolate reductase
MPANIKVILLMATTVDGKIAKDPDHFPDWTGAEDKRFFARTSKEAGVVIMGSKTFDTFGNPLPGRKNVILTQNKSRRSTWDNLVYTARKPELILNDLAKEGYTSAILAGGAAINTLFAQQDLIDEVVITLVPKIFGIGLSLFSSEVDLKLELIDMQKLGKDLVCLRYAVIK